MPTFEETMARIRGMSAAPGSSSSFEDTMARIRALSAAPPLAHSDALYAPEPVNPLAGVPTTERQIFYDTKSDQPEVQAEAGRLRAGLKGLQPFPATVPFPSKPIMPEFPTPPPQTRLSNEELPATTIVRGLGGGLAGMVRGVAGNVQAVAENVSPRLFQDIPGISPMEALGKAASKVAEGAEALESMWRPPPDIEGGLDKPENFSDPKWWLDFGGRLVGSMLPFMVGGTLGQAAALRVAPLATWGPKGAELAMRIGGVASAALTDAVVESGNVYRDMLEKTKDRAVSAASAAEVFAKNAVLTGLTSGLAFFGAPAARGAVGKGVRAATEIASEVTQETGQERISAEAKGEKLTPGQLKQAALGGAVGGAVMGPAITATTRAIERGAQRSEQERAESDALKRIAAYVSTPEPGRVGPNRPMEFGTPEDLRLAYEKVAGQRGQDIPITAPPVPFAEPLQRSSSTPILLPGRTTTRPPYQPPATAGITPVGAQPGTMRPAARIQAETQAAQDAEDEALRRGEITDPGQVREIALRRGLPVESVVRMSDAEVRETLLAQEEPPERHPFGVISQAGGIDPTSIGTRYYSIPAVRRTALFERGVLSKGGMSLTDAAKQVGVTPDEVYGMLRRDKAPERAATPPVAPPEPVTPPGMAVSLPAAKKIEQAQVRTTEAQAKEAEARATAAEKQAQVLKGGQTAPAVQGRAETQGETIRPVAEPRRETVGEPSAPPPSVVEKGALTSPAPPRPEAAPPVTSPEGARPSAAETVSPKKLSLGDLTPAEQKSEVADNSDFVTRYLEQARKVRASEKTPERKMTPAEMGLNNKDWKAYSRQRGYTEAEIADVEKLDVLFDEGISRGYTGDELAGLEKRASEGIRPPAAEAVPPASVTPVVGSRAVTLNVSGRQRTVVLTPEQAQEWDAAKIKHAQYIEFIKRQMEGGLDKETASKQMKAAAMRHEAEKRQISGVLTVKEQKAADAAAKTLIPGRPVMVKLQDGTEITGTVQGRPVFGKVSVKLDDGRTMSVEADAVSVRQAPPVEPSAMPAPPASAQKTVEQTMTRKNYDDLMRMPYIKEIASKNPSGVPTYEQWKGGYLDFVGRAGDLTRQEYLIEVLRGKRPVFSSIPPAPAPATPAPPVTPQRQPLRPAAEGNEGTAYTPDNQPVRFRYALVEADQPLVSHDTALTPNPAFPTELQPRERDRAAYETQVNNIVQEFNPLRLGENINAGDGAPLLGPEGVVEGGNGRMIALRRIYQNPAHGSKRDAYRQFLADNAGKFGLDPQVIASARRPVLVRVRVGDVADLRKFVKDINAPTVAGMSPAERAKNDAEAVGRIIDLFRPDESGNVGAFTNAEFNRRFIETIPETERGTYQAADGQLNDEGIRRVRNGVFSYLYGDPSAIARLTERSGDDQAKNVTNAMLASAGPIGQLKSKVQAGALASNLDITPDIATAANKLSALRSQGIPVAEYLAQVDPFDKTSELSKAILENVFDRFGRSGKKITQALKYYAELADTQGDPRQVGLFGGGKVASPESLLRVAIEKVEGEPDAQVALFGEGQPSARPGVAPVSEAEVSGRTVPTEQPLREEAQPAPGEPESEDAFASRLDARPVGTKITVSAPDEPHFTGEWELKSIGSTKLWRKVGSNETQPSSAFYGLDVSGPTGGGTLREEPAPYSQAKPTRRPVRPGIVMPALDDIPVPTEHIKKGQYDIDEYQRLAVNVGLTGFGQGNKAFLLADGTGVGKTREILVLAHETARKSGKPSLIITASQQIIDGNYRPDAVALNVSIPKGEGGASTPTLFRSEDVAESPVRIGTYDMLRTGHIGRGEYGLVVFDEAHNLKNLYAAKTIAAQGVVADKIVYATATPMDRPQAASYFLSEVTGIPEEQVQRFLGFELVPEVRGDRVVQVPVLLKDHDWDSVLKNIVALRNRAIQQHAAIRREYPFFGDVKVQTVPMSGDLKDEQLLIENYWDEKIERTPPGPAKRALAGQKLQELGRWLESKKADHVLAQLKKDLTEGRSVIVVAETVEPQLIKALSRQDKGFMGVMAAALEKEGIPFAAIYGDSEKSAQVARFQEGRVQVALATPQSGGAGIDLDDSVGDRPRTLYLVSVPYSGDVFDQVLGRVSRRNTKTPAQVRIVQLGGTFSDTRRDQIMGRKLEVLRRIQRGDDPDLALPPPPSLRGASGTVREDVAPYSSEPTLAPEFYSALRNAIEKATWQNIKAESIKNYLAKQEGVKKVEIEATGLGQWIDERQGERVSRQDILDYLDENGVKVRREKYDPAQLEMFGKQAVDDIRQAAANARPVSRGIGPLGQDRRSDTLLPGVATTLATQAGKVGTVDEIGQTLVRRIEPVEFVGKTVRTYADVAAVGETIRNPLIETFLVGAIDKNGKIVAIQATTSWLPGASEVPLFTSKKISRLKRDKADGRVSEEEYENALLSLSIEQAYRMLEWARRAGGNRIFFLHNHPSGKPTPSKEDMNVTGHAEAAFSEVAARVGMDPENVFFGHIIVNSGEYAFLHQGEGEVRDLPLDIVQRYTNQSVGRTIGKPEDVAAVGKDINVPKNAVALIFADTKNRVRGVEIMPVGEFVRPKEAADRVRGLARRVYGGGQVFAYAKDATPEVKNAVYLLIDNGSLVAAVMNEKSLYVPPNPEQMLGLSTELSLPMTRLAEEPAPYGESEEPPPDDFEEGEWMPMRPPRSAPTERDMSARDIFRTLQGLGRLHPDAERVGNTILLADNRIRRRILDYETEVDDALSSVKEKELSPLFQVLDTGEGLGGLSPEGREARDRVKEMMDTARQDIITTMRSFGWNVADDWGIDGAFLAHVFPGQYLIYATAPDGGKRRVIDSAYNGLSARFKVWQYAKLFAPGTTFTWEAKPTQNPDITRLPATTFDRMTKGLAEAMAATPADIRDATRGIVGTTASRAKGWGNLMPRTGAGGYSDDIREVLHAYFNGLVRWQEISETNRQTDPLIASIEGQGYIALSNELKARLKTFWGEYSSTTRLLDNELKNTPVVKELVQPFALERWMGQARKGTAILMLGSPGFHIANTLQVLQTLYPIVSEGELLRGVSAFASRDGQRLLSKHGVSAADKYVEGRTERRPLMEEAGFYLKFIPPLASERRNQEIAFLTLYHKALKEEYVAPNRLLLPELRHLLKDRSLTADSLPRVDKEAILDASAAIFARLHGQFRSQFMGSRVDYPGFADTPIKKTVFQFTRFTVKEVELAGSILSGKEFVDAPYQMKGGRVPAIAKMVIFRVLMSGIRWATLLAGVGTAKKLWDKVEEEWGEGISDFFAKGASTLLGLDLSSRFAPIHWDHNKNIPEIIGETALGPLGSSAVGVGWEIVRPERTGEKSAPGVVDRLKRGGRYVMERYPLLRFMTGMVKWAQGDYDISTPGGLLKSRKDLAEALAHISNIKTLSESKQRDLLDAITAMNEAQNDIKVRIVNALAKNDTALANDLIRQAYNLGLSPDAEDLKQDVEKAQHRAGMTETERRVVGVNRNLRPMARPLVKDPETLARWDRSDRDALRADLIDLEARARLTRTGTAKKADLNRQLQALFEKAGGQNAVKTQYGKDLMDDQKQRGDPYRYINGYSAWIKRVNEHVLEIRKQKNQEYRHAAD